MLLHSVVKNVCLAGLIQLKGYGALLFTVLEFHYGVRMALRTGQMPTSVFGKSNKHNLNNVIS